MTHRITALTVVALIAFALPTIALAHAHLEESDPAAGATLTTTPYTLTATFSEEIDPEASSLVVERPDGSAVVEGGVSADDPTMMTAELPLLEPGEYVVRWTTVTPDDNGVERGTYTFNVAAAAPSATAAPTAPPATGTGGGNDLLIALVLAAVAIGGVVLFVFLRGRR